MLKRKFYDSLLRWKSSHSKECLLVKGARQIGKTFIIDYFGKRNYSSYLYLNFILDKTATECFGDNLNADEIFKMISVHYPRFNLVPGDTMLFLDEIQSCPRARTALKSFALDGRADVVASGSLLGLAFLDDGLNKDRARESIPVGYENQVVMYPMDFEEYLWALGYDENVIGMLRESFHTVTPVDFPINDKFLSLFREYITIGGMPEVVDKFITDNSFSRAYDVQVRIKNSNLDDMRLGLKSQKFEPAIFLSPRNSPARTRNSSIPQSQAVVRLASSEARSTGCANRPLQYSASTPPLPTCRLVSITQTIASRCMSRTLAS